MCKTWCVLNILLHKLIKTHNVLHFFFKKWSKNGPKTASRRPQDGSKMDLVSGPVFEPIFGPIWGAFWDHFLVILGSIFGSFLKVIYFGPTRMSWTTSPHSDASSKPLETDPGASWAASGAPEPWEFSSKLKIPLSSPRTVLGTILERFGAHLGPSQDRQQIAWRGPRARKSVQEGPFQHRKKDTYKGNSRHISASSGRATNTCKNWGKMKIRMH